MRVIAAIALLCLSANASAEVLIRWDHDRIPSRESLGIASVAIPADRTAAVQSALAQGYRVYLETDAERLATLALPGDALAGVIVRGTVPRSQRRQFTRRLKSPGARLLTVDERAKWPHIRSNWVTKNNEVLQVAGRTAQPWIENNAALLCVLEGDREAPDDAPLMTYTWKPTTLSEEDEGPALANYLIAIAEAGSFGADLLLPLHVRFQKDLLLGRPETRRDWIAMRRYIDFYSWDLPRRYERIANIGVVTGEPMLWYEVLNLLSRHNLPFRLIAPSQLAERSLTGLDLLIVLDEPAPAQRRSISAFEQSGGTVFTVKTPVVDPNAFALEMRQILGREHRAIDIWNGITVLAAAYKEPDGNNLLVTAINYAHEPLPIQVRIRGTFSTVSYESPDGAPALLPFRHRDAHTEFVLPALYIGGRVFLSR